MRSLAALLLVVSPGFEEPEAPRTWVRTDGFCAWFGYPDESTGASLSKHVLLFPGERSVSMEWQRWGPVDEEDDREGAVDFSEESVEFSTEYWPTFATWIAEEKLIIAGLSVGERRTIIELWDFEQMQPKVLNGEWDLPARESVQRVYESSAQFSPKVVGGVRNLGDPNSVFLRFEEWNPLYSLDLETGVLSVAASPYMSGPVTADFLAAKNREELWDAAEHPQGGYVYRHEWVSHTPCKSNMFTFSHYLLDTDRDGTIDKLNTRGQMRYQKLFD